ncbi:MAG TPA: zinc-ribbon domain containing protein [Chloroflexia bacterium]|nr:zinc-ribbon domain containing protein [Chloroflexia bacterium]
MFFADRTLVCKDCANPFLFTAGEQDFYRQRGLMHEPGRCPDCRNRRKQQAIEQGLVSSEATTPVVMREVSKVICAECGTETTVPFRPRQARPVYCALCLQKHRAASEQPPETSKQQEEAVNSTSTEIMA